MASQDNGTNMPVFLHNCKTELESWREALGICAVYQVIPGLLRTPFPSKLSEKTLVRPGAPSSDALSFLVASLLLVLRTYFSTFVFGSNARSQPRTAEEGAHLRRDNGVWAWGRPCATTKNVRSFGKRRRRNESTKESRLILS